MAKTIKGTGRYTLLDVSTLEVDPPTQRTLQPTHVADIAENFDPDQLGEIVVSLRDGHYYVVDGQHRVEAIRKMGWGDQKVPVKLYDSLTQAEEAVLYLRLQKRRQPKAIDNFRISIVGLNEIDCDIERIVKSCGLTVSNQKKDGSIAAVSALRRVYSGAGLAQQSPTALAKALRVLKAAWGGSAASFDRGLILGAGMLVIRYNGSVDLDALTAKLAKVGGGPSGLLGRAKSVMEMKRRPEGHCVASVMVDTYNSGKGSKSTTKLEDWWA